MANEPLREKPLEVKRIIYFSLAILGLELINFIWQRGYLHLYSAMVFLVMIGFFGFLMWGIWHGKNWIRLVWIIVSLIGIPITLLTLSTRSMSREIRIIYSIQFAFSLLILYHLMKKESLSWYKRMEKTRLSITTSRFQKIGGEQKGNKRRKLNYDNREKYEKWKAEKLKTVTESQQDKLTAENDFKLVPGEIWKDPLLGMEFAFVNGGWFEMDDILEDVNHEERSAYRVYVEGFWMGKFVVTQGQWEKLLGNNPSVYKKGNDYPVEHVSWDDAREFIFGLNQKTAMSFRLPTEEEWEYAARSEGKKERWAGTDNESELTEYAWYGINSGGGTHPVGQKRPNGLGLYDMSGNVWEWVQKDYGVVEQEKVIRGGSWSDPPTALRTSGRTCIAPNDKVIFTGFRLVLPIK